MAKPIISNTILAIVAAGVLFFIGRSVYDVFTRAPVRDIQNHQVQDNSSQSAPTVSGTIQLPAELTPEPTDPSGILPAVSNNAPASQNQPTIQPQPPEPAVVAPSSAPQSPVTEAEPTTEETDEPHALKINPDLRQAIPPVPLAPPSPFPTPVAPASDKQLFEATDNLDSSQTTYNDNIGNGFPAPQPNFPAPGTTPGISPEPAPFETGEGSPFSNFPAPVNNSNTHPGNINSSNPEFEQLQNLQLQKERLRKDLGFWALKLSGNKKSRFSSGFFMSG